MSDQTERIPNFLIVGPTKCGTTSFSIYINQHPDVFIPRLKEPHFFSNKVASLPLGGPGSDKVEASYIKTFGDYKELYSGRTEKALGDATADTIYYKDRIVPVIKEHIGDPKIIIILRDPVKRAFSAYQHLIRDRRESLTFEEALEQEEQRISENYDPLFHYRSCSMYADAVKVFRQSFTDVLVLFTSDLYEQPDETFRTVFEFLGVDPDFKVDSGQRHNISGKPKNQAINDFVSKESKLRSLLRPLIRLFTTEAMRKKVVYNIQKKNLQRLEMLPETESRLRKYFSEDIEALEKELDVELGEWKA